MCQIGAAVMADKGFKAEEILAHYFSGANLLKLYE
jgi:peptidoglycan hydrolase-like amidase